MFIPKPFAAKQDQLHSFVNEYGFASLITRSNDQWFTTMVPLLLEPGDTPVLHGHMARANPHWRHLSDNPSLVIFQGPHAYISPSFYEQTAEVPTWNYAMARATVSATVFHDTDALNELVLATVEKFEAPLGNPWDREIDQDYWQRQLEFIVGFRLEVQELTGKFKLGQNRSAEDQGKMKEALKQSEAGAELYRFIEGRLKAEG